MYKVVTHTIKEEHFEHPVLAEKGMAIHTNGTTGNTSPKWSGTPRWGGKGNVRPRMEPNSVISCPPTDGNLVVKMPLENDWEGYQWYESEYHAWGDVKIHGQLMVSSDLTVDGVIAGRGSVSTVTVLSVVPTGNTWAGNIGELARTDSHMYLCVEPDKWVRWSIQSNW